MNHTYYIVEDTSVPRVKNDHYWYEAFAPHGNTPENPYWSDSDSEGRRVHVEIALTLAREWVREYGARRARMGYDINTPFIDQLRTRELSMIRVKTCYDDNREPMATVGRSVPDQEDFRQCNEEVVLGEQCLH